jgi:glycosyltransferase involved in cell wall biosynthesis
MKIETYVLVNNEELLVPYIMRHYGQYGKVIFIESNSTDRTVELATTLGGWVHKYNIPDELDNIAMLDMKQSCWKGSEADWVMVVDADEFIYHPNLIEVLERSHATVIHPTFHNMFSERFPTTKGQIYDEVFMGTRDGGMWKSKMNIFRPDQITNMNYGIGAHTATPSGNVIIDSDSGVKTFHMNFLGREYLIARYERNKKRHTQKDIENGWGQQSFWSAEKINQFFDENIPNLIKLT